LEQVTSTSATEKFKYPSQGRFNSRYEHNVALREEGEVMLRDQLVQNKDQ